MSSILLSSCSFIIFGGISSIWWLFHESLGYKPAQLVLPSDRLVYTIKLLIFSTIPLVLSVNHVMIGRMSNPVALNPLSGNEHLVEKEKRILQNNVEQFLLHSVNLLIFSVVISKKYIFTIPYLVFVFTTARIIYMIGYSIDPMNRAVGFRFTFFPTMAVFIFNLIKVFCDFF